MVYTSTSVFTLAISLIGPLTAYAKSQGRASQKWWEGETQEEFKKIILANSNSRVLRDEKTILCYYKSDQGERKFTSPGSDDDNPCQAGYFAIKYFKNKSTKQPHTFVARLYAPKDGEQTLMMQVGEMFVKVDDTEVRSMGIAVSGAFQGKGLGTVLVAAAFLVGKQENEKKTSVLDNNASMEFYWLNNKGDGDASDVHCWEIEDCGKYMSGTMAYLKALGLHGCPYYSIGTKSGDKTIEDGVGEINTYIKQCEESVRQATQQPDQIKVALTRFVPCYKIEKKQLKGVNDFDHNFNGQRIYGFSQKQSENLKESLKPVQPAVFLKESMHKRKDKYGDDLATLGIPLKRHRSGHLRMIGEED